MSAEGEVGPLGLGDLIDVGAVQSLMDSFYQLAHVPMSLIDLEGRVLVGVGWQDICTHFHRVHPASCRHCVQSDTELSRGVAPGEYRLYRCKNNMWDVATPIMVGGRHVANLFSGQFFFDDEAPDRELFRRQARRFGFPESEYLAALARVPRLARTALTAGMSFFMRLADMLSTLGLSNLRIAQISRLYAVLSQVNGALVRSRDETSLFQEVCQILATQGGFPLVWVGLERGNQVIQVASAGSAVGYLEEIRVEVNGRLGSGPTGTSIREDRPVVNDDFETSGATSPWRESALRYGIRASAAFPLRRNGQAVGSLSLYARTPGTFVPEQVELLEALGANISFALDAMVQQAALRQSELELREADRRKNEFLAMLSHELRNPLAPIRNGIHVLARAVPGGAQAQHAQAVIDRQVAHLTRLVDELLDVTRIERGKIRLLSQPLDLNDIVCRTVEDHRSLFEQNGIEILVHPDAERLWIDGDSIRISQIISNLLQNAVKFTPCHGRTWVSVGGESGWAVVRVRDTGAGIPPEVMPTLFQPFVQLEDTLDRSRGGLGLGLALVKGLVELHGGEVSVESSGPGRGSEFVIRLPLAPKRPVSTSTPGSPVARRPRRVLVIEDNVDAADTLREALELDGHDVSVAYSGSDGLVKAAQRTPEVVFCDIGLPGMDGYQVARAFKSDPRLAEVVLVALTGYALPEDLARAVAAGFSTHIAKPPSLEQIESVLLSGPALAERREDHGLGISSETL